ncbi:hypothetical protein B0H14DRAFT_3146386 [Mycena olivaceomarginata]|nr:hypothetical protein B0H14DRAFT_3146386 [Mycena olivaceomarginata]
MSTMPRSLSPLSSLTPGPDEDQDQDFDLPTSAAENAYGLVLDVIRDLERQIAGVQLAPERQQDLTDSMKLLGRSASQKPYKVAIVGRTEISYKDGRDITAKILYKSPAQWKLELDHLVADALEANADFEESAATSHLSPAYQAREKLYQIYPHLRDSNVVEWNADSLLADPTVSDYLGKEPIISASDHEDFGKELEQCLSSCGDRTIWPLVESVHIRGPFPVLSTGITLVDLPGHGDVDNTRDKVANEYMRDASTVFLVTSIARAIDERDTHQYLEKHLSQIIVDGRISEKSIALILTGTDIPFDEKAAGTTEIAKLTKEIKRLEGRIDRRPQDDKVKGWRDQITQRRNARDQLISQRHIVLAQQRSHAVASALQEKCQQIYSTLSQLPEVESNPHIPIFCVGSWDFLTLSRLLPANPLVFSSKEDTSIPALHEYIQLIGEFHNLTDGIDLLAVMYQLLNRASHVPSADRVGPEMRQEIINLEKRCTDRALTLVQSIEAIFKTIAAEVAKAVSVAAGRSPTIFENIARTLKWNQYLALMRREGEYGANDLNMALTATILPSVQTQWHLGINVEISSLLSDFFQEIKADLDKTIQTLQDRSSTNIDTVRKSLGVDSFVKQLSRAVQQSIAVRQRKGNRIWAPLIKEQLVVQYGTVAAERGRGMFGRMKLNMAFIRDSAHEIFEPLNDGTRMAFAGSVEQVQIELLGGIKRILREIRLLFIGFETNDLEGLALVETVLHDNEDGIFRMMDVLKSRRQEIELHL